MKPRTNGKYVVVTSSSIRTLIWKDGRWLDYCTSDGMPQFIDEEHVRAFVHVLDARMLIKKAHSDIENGAAYDALDEQQRQTVYFNLHGEYSIKGYTLSKADVLETLYKYKKKIEDCLEPVDFS